MPREKARATGRDTINPGRFANRTEPKNVPPLGIPPRWMNDNQKAAWKTFQSEVFWLDKSHRALMEIACILRSRAMGTDSEGVKSLNLLRQCLGMMGATPADASKVSFRTSDCDDDPASNYFQ